MSRAARPFLLLAVACPLSACGLLLDFDPPDPPPVDAGPGIDAGPVIDGSVHDAHVHDAALDATTDATRPDAGPMSPCFGRMDGDDCTGSTGGPARLICIAGACVPSVCGDGFVDARGGEQCEPTLDSTCDARTCRYECSGDSDCPVISPCLGVSCMSHRCMYAADHGGLPCTTAGGGTGACAAGICLLPGCGNGTVDPGEDCDLGTLPSPGCHGCRFDCHTDADCSDGDPCNGDETCHAFLDVMSRTVGKQCMPAPDGVLCPTPPACFAGGCVADPAGMASCERHLIDGDGDGFAAGDACGMFGGDCNDADPNVHPGATEACNMIDDDCNGLVDDNTMTVTWCHDGDGDGYGDPTMSIVSCLAPAGPFVRDCTDCWDSADPTRSSEAALVHPMQARFFTTPYCPISPTAGCSYDYDCDGTELEQTTGTVTCGALAPLICASGAGWEGTVPACGDPGVFATCRGVSVLGIGLLCRDVTSSQTQACH